MNLALFSGKETALTRNSLLTILPVLPKQYEFSFDFKPTKFVGGWSNILHLTTGGDEGWGIPRFFVLNKKVAIASALDGNGQWQVWSPVLKVNEWVHFRVTQIIERHEYVYRVYMNKQLLKTKVNKRPEEFQLVKVWVSDNSYPASPGYVKNIQLKGNHFYTIFQVGTS